MEDNNKPEMTGKDAQDTESPDVHEPVNTDDSPIESDKGHKRKWTRGRIAAAAIAAVFIVGIIGSLVPCSHEWASATCTEPKTCLKCGETEGEPLGHDWAEATCTEAQNCQRCGMTRGDPLGHNVTEWVVDVQPTCTAEGSQHGTCTRCGQTQTQSIPMVNHTEGEWVVLSAPSVSTTGDVTPGVRALTCSVCGATIRTESINLEVSVSQVNALRSAQSYLSFMAFSYSGLIEQLEYEGYSTEDATFAADYCGADWNEQAAKSAASYLDFMAFSRSGLIDQLLYEGFTTEQAEYGVNSVGL